VQAVEAALTEDPFWSALYQLVLTIGVQSSELRALRWSDVDLERGIAIISRTITRDADWHVIIGESTKSGRARAAALPAVTCASLKCWQTAQKARRLAATLWYDEDIVFDRGNGRYLPLTTWQRKHATVIAAAGVKSITPHQLRRTDATIDLETGISPKIVAERLGHRRIETTLDMYQHISIDIQRAVAESLADRLYGNDANTTTSGSS
jgi:integrase